LVHNAEHDHGSSLHRLRRPGCRQRDHCLVGANVEKPAVRHEYNREKDR
jgi:hypothetical protein